MPKNLSSIASRTGSSSTPATMVSSTTTHLVNSRTNLKHSCLQFKFGFYMDDVEHVRNTSTYHETFLLCPDPEIYPFDNDGKRIQYRYDYLTIEGSNLLDVATMDDYFITIGSYPCNITSISDKQIVCQPTNRTIEQLSRRKRFSLDPQMRDYDQAIVRVSPTSAQREPLQPFIPDLGHTGSSNLHIGNTDLYVEYGEALPGFVLYHRQCLRISLDCVHHHCIDHISTDQYETYAAASSLAKPNRYVRNARCSWMQRRYVTHRLVSNIVIARCPSCSLCGTSDGYRRNDQWSLTLRSAVPWLSNVLYEGSFS